MSDQDRTMPAQSGGYYLCDLARTSRDFSVIDVESAEIVELPTEEDTRALVDLKYPGSRLFLTSGKPALEIGEDLGKFVVIAVAKQEVVDGPWKAVAYVGAAVHGPLCVPFSPVLWHDAADLVGISRMPSLSARHDALREANASWRPLETPHAYREKPAGVEWPVGPRGETCVDCGKDPRNQIHKV